MTHLSDPDAGEPARRVRGGAADSKTIAPEHAAGMWTRFSLLFGAEVGSRGLRFVADILLVRHFSQSAFGQLNVAQSLAIQGLWLSTCGLNTAGVRSVAVEPDTAPAIAATVVILRCCLASMTWTAIAGLAWAVPQYRDSCGLVSLYGLSLFTGALNIAWVAQGRGQIRPLGVGLLAATLVYLGGVQLAVWRVWPLASVPVALVVGEALAAAGVWLWVVRGIGPVRRPLPRSAALRFLRESLPIGGANFLRGMMPGSDVLLLGLFVGKAEVGQYAAAVKLYTLGSVLLGAYFAVLLPQFSRCAAESLSSLKGELSVGIRRTLLAAIPVTALALLVAPNVLSLLFGPGFADAATALRLLLLVLPLQLLAGHWRFALVALGRQRDDLRLAVWGAVVHVGAKLGLIPAFGNVGAAWGTFAGEVALLVLAWYAGRTTLRDGAAPKVRSEPGM